MNEPDEVLATIRRAYRYVVAYERRVLDAIDVVDEALRERGFARESPHRTPLYTSFPSKSGYAPDHWTWDNVPNYACRYEWSCGDANAAGNRWVLVDHVADTSFEGFCLRDPATSPDPLSGVEAHGSRSILRWAVIDFAGPLPEKVYNRFWGQLLSSHFAQPLSALRITDPTNAPVVLTEAPLTLTRHCIDIAELTDGDALRTRFVEPLLATLAAL